jgi:hypothetical protein
LVSTGRGRSVLDVKDPHPQIGGQSGTGYKVYRTLRESVRRETVARFGRSKPCQTRRGGQDGLAFFWASLCRYWSEWMTIMPSPYSRQGTRQSIRTKQGGVLRTVKTKTIGRRLIYSIDTIQGTLATYHHHHHRSLWPSYNAVGVHTFSGSLVLSVVRRVSVHYYSRTRTAGPKGNMPPDDSMGRTTINSTRPHQHLYRRQQQQ